LTAHAVRQIVERTDGIPLFLEELTKAVVESSADGDGTFPTASSSDSAIPATLHDSLMARLDRLGPAKQVAQIGAVIGREFSFELLASVSERYSPSELRASLDQLIASGLLLRRGTEADIFLFKHALVQDAAYSTLLRRPRQQLHDKIARALEAHFPDRAAREPEVLAHHFSEASEPLRASEYWLTAGAQAARRSANVEAIAHFSRGLNELKSLPSGPDKDRRELALQTAIGTPLISVHGYAAAQTGAAYSRARALCHQYGDSLSLHAMLSGEFVYHFVRGDYEVMRQLAAEAGRSAERTGDEALLLAGHRMAGCLRGRPPGWRRPGLREHVAAGFRHDRRARVGHDLAASSLAGSECAADHVAVRRGLVRPLWPQPLCPEDEADPGGGGGREGPCHDSEPVVRHGAHLRPSSFPLLTPACVGGG